MAPAPEAIRVSPQMLELSRSPAAEALAAMGSRAGGLTTGEAVERLEQYGPNVAASDRGSSPWRRVGHAVANPLVVLLAVLSGLSFATGDFRAGTVMRRSLTTAVELTITWPV